MERERERELIGRKGVTSMTNLCVVVLFVFHWLCLFAFVGLILLGYTKVH